MNDESDLGTAIDVDGRPAVRFVRTFSHPIDRVWSAVTAPEELMKWFPARVDIELRVAGDIVFSGDPHLRNQHGTVLVCDPPHHVGFTWGDDELYFDLEEMGDGHCRFTLTNVLSAADSAARNAAGWSVCLGELDKHMAGEHVGGPHSESARPWRPLYDAYRAAGMASGAEIPQNR